MALAPLTSGSETSTADSGIDRNGNSAAELKNEFLTLMVAQIKNQDPLNPMDGAEYVSQLAEFSTVEGVENMSRMQRQNNIQLDTLQVLQSTQLVGRQVSVAGDNIRLTEMDSLSGTVQLPAGVSDLRVVAIGADGQVAGKVELGARSAGAVEYNLPPLPQGSYRLEALAARGGQVETLQPNVHRTVEKVSVPPNGGDVRLQVEGMGLMSLFSVSEFLGAES